MRKDGYPDNWDDIAADVKDAAGRVCENCGSPSVPRRVLTVHHLDMNSMNCAPENLVALCQACHLRIQAKYFPGQLWLYGRPVWAVRRDL